MPYLSRFASETSNSQPPFQTSIDDTKDLGPACLVDRIVVQKDHVLPTV